jgi:ubiquinone/menaquinone biosynthesis C-methylase UbiE
MALDYNLLAKDYARNRKIHPEVLAHLVKNGAISSQTRALELGCGTGNYCLALQQNTNCEMAGIDPSIEMLKIAKSQLAAGTPLFNARGEALCLPDNVFDLAFSVDVIHHVIQRDEFYSEARRVLKPGGLCCTVTDSEEIIRSRRMFHYFAGGVEIELKRYPPIQKLITEMGRAGFVNIGQEDVDFSFELTSIEAYKNRAFSFMQYLDEESFKAGISRMEVELQKGPIPYNSRYTMVWGQKAK